ncbi:putative RTA1 domain protein [Hypoxylon sp. FL1150]|nr:putative RTA1 domain protein [Hypoxylon sp. FL1150]
MEDGQPVPGSLFVYAPNKGAPVFFACAFAASAAGHIWQCYRYKCFKIIGLHPLCALMFAAGYALREYAAFNYLYSTQNLIIYILSQVFIYVCPPLLELANYHVLGRIFYYVPYFAPLPPGKVLSTFGGLMALVEILNALGVALSSNPSSSASHQELGSNLTITALAIQFAVILSCAILAGIFHGRCSRAKIHSRAISIPLNTLYVSLALILIRCIYRFVEHLGNTSVDLDDFESLKTLSPILRYEWFFYVFEAALMFANSVLWNIWNPGRYLPRNYHVYLDRDGVTEIEGEAKLDSRSLLAKIGSVLTFGLLFHEKKDGESYWLLKPLTRRPQGNGR